MKWLKSYKLFESNDSTKEMVQDFLRDFSDSDIPVEVEVHQPDPLGSSEDRVLILIGDEDNMVLAKDLPLYENINNFISLNEYLIDEGYGLMRIACWIKPHNEPIAGQRPITITPENGEDVQSFEVYNFQEFDKFISKIEEIEDWNRRYWYSVQKKSFKLIDICYTKS